MSDETMHKPKHETRPRKRQSPYRFNILHKYKDRKHKNFTMRPSTACLAQHVPVIPIIIPYRENADRQSDCTKRAGQTSTKFVFPSAIARAYTKGQQQIQVLKIGHNPPSKMCLFCGVRECSSADKRGPAQSSHSGGKLQYEHIDYPGALICEATRCMVPYPQADAYRPCRTRHNLQDRYTRNA